MAFINLTGGARVLRQAAAQLGAVFSLKTFAFVEAVAFTAPCSHTRKHTHTHAHDERCSIQVQVPGSSETARVLTVLALITQEVVGTLAGGLVPAADRAVASVLAVILTGVQVAVRPREARQASAGRRACGQSELVQSRFSSEATEPGFPRVVRSELRYFCETYRPSVS